MGANGAGKSTILKLATRLYDPDEGEIFFNGHNIRTLKLDDLRRAISVLFQDYTLFPLSVSLSPNPRPPKLTSLSPVRRSATTSPSGTPPPPRTPPHQKQT